MSEPAVNELIQQKVQSLWNAFNDAQAISVQERAEMKVEIKALKFSEDNLKKHIEDFKNKVEDLRHQNENFSLNNAELIDRVERVETENAGLRKMLQEIDLT